MTTASGADTIADRDLKLTRIIDAPREKVFRAWTEPEILKQSWGICTDQLAALVAKL